ncbi:ImmA/IrrE family metallo-endopeptidase [Corynebacterium renale]|uniref:ImmA/IrrE family metallo-endopeptidase n=1 Tax=Corynebacterium renale TaxID=1724 RepID=UPI000E1B9524|nr:ImmA/IrrE family metallo-endopeptidase [Corynebacterium renale]
MDALIEVAEHRGYRVRWHKGGPEGAWLPHKNTVSIRIGMGDAETLCVLAHELGHAHYDDPAGHDNLQEARADRFAARLLIDPVEYALAEYMYGPYPSRLASELGVTTHILATWQTLHERIPS